MREANTKTPRAGRRQRRTIMGLTRPELGMLAIGCALVGWAAWLLISVDDRVERDLLEMRMRSSSAVVLVG